MVDYYAKDQTDIILNIEDFLVVIKKEQLLWNYTKRLGLIWNLLFVHFIAKQFFSFFLVGILILFVALALKVNLEAHPLVSVELCHVDVHYL